MWDLIEAEKPILMSEDEFRTFIHKEQFSESSQQAANSTAMLLRTGRDAEVFVGGDDSKSLIQVLGGSQGGELDIVCSLLIPTDPVQCVGTARGIDALQLLAVFWERYPQAPLLVPRGDGHAHVTCSLSNKDWTVAPLSAQHIGKLHSLAELDDTINVQIPMILSTQIDLDARHLMERTAVTEDSELCEL